MSRDAHDHFGIDGSIAVLFARPAILFFLVSRHATKGPLLETMRPLGLGDKVGDLSCPQLLIRVVDVGAREEIRLRSPESSKMPAISAGDSHHTQDVISPVLPVVRCGRIIFLHRKRKSLLHVTPGVSR